MTNRFLLALNGKNNSSIPPVWLMRQAGRYMKEYQVLRQKHSFVELCKTPELAYRVTKLPIDTFGFDAAIIFSDILFICELFGRRVVFDDQQGPVITPSFSRMDDFVSSSDECLDFVMQAISLWKEREELPLIGFAGGPFTVASYLIEGKMGSDFSKTKAFFYSRREEFLLLLDRITEKTIVYLNQQIQAGVDAVQVFDSWATLLPGNFFAEYMERYLRRLFEGLSPCPRLFFCRGASIWYETLATLPIQGISLDWQVELISVRKKVGCVLQGNLDPDVLLTDPETVRREVKKIVDPMRCDPGFIFNLGHGVLKNTPEENVRALIETVRDVANS